MTRFTVLKTGGKPSALAEIAGDYAEWIAEGMGCDAAAVAVIDAQHGPLPAPDTVDALVITGSAAMVTDDCPWIGAAAGFVRALVALERPVLGICFGHQLLAHALGGAVGWNPRGLEIGTVEITLQPPAADDPLFAALPRQFPAQASHRQSVLRLPPGARLLASSERDPHQAFTVGSRCYGVQFHPEIGERLMPTFIAGFRKRLLADGRAPETIIGEVRATPESASLLRRFRALAESDQSSISPAADATRAGENPPPLPATPGGSNRTTR